MNTKKLWWMTSLMLVGAIVIAACGTAATAVPPAVAPVEEEPAAPVEEEPAEPVEEVPAEPERGVMTVAHSNEWGGNEELDPASPTRFQNVAYPLFDRMIDLDVNGRPKGRLLVSWEADEFAQTWTFQVRQGVTFHDGKPLTARDIVYTMRNVLDPEFASPAAAALSLVDVDGLQVLDDYTVVVPLTQPHSDFPLLLTDYRLRVIPEGSKDDPNSPDYLEKTGNGTGPFRLETLDIDGITVLVANDDYWDGPPGLAGINVVGIADSDARVQALLAGQIDMMENVAAEQANQIEGNPGYTILELPSGNWAPLSMSVITSPFDDIRVRQALKLVVDRAEMLAIVAQGAGVIACDSPVHPSDQYYLKQECPQDIERAKELLAEAGYADGLTVDLHVSDIRPLMIPMAVVFKEQAAEAGITVNIITEPSDGYWSDVWLKDSFVAGNWGERHADQVLNEVFRCDAAWNEIDWCNEEYEQLMDAARGELDFEKRLTLYHQAQELLVADGGEIIPFFLSATRIFNSLLVGLPERSDDIYDWQAFRFEPGE